MADSSFTYPGLTGRVALVTGANHGIGAATALRLASAGARVLATFLRLDLAAEPGREDYWRPRTQGGDLLVESIRAAGGRAVALEADLADPATAATLFDRAEEAFGPVFMETQKQVPPAWPQLTATTNVFSRRDL